jgi:leucyl-tRNA synthetase
LFIHIFDAEFTIGYQRLLGKKTLHPFGFHCTGMPIAACASKLAREMETYGIPPVVGDEEAEVVVGEAQTSQEKPGEVAGKFKSKKSKAGAKTGHAKLQWDILKDMKVDPEEIPKFSDPYYWLEYFPIRGQGDLKRFGMYSASHSLPCHQFPHFSGPSSSFCASFLDVLHFVI